MIILAVALSGTGLLAAIVPGVYALTHRAGLVSKTNSDGSRVMRKGAKISLAAAYALVFGAAASGYTLYRALTAGEAAIELTVMGLFFVLFGIFFLRYAAEERIEYDDREIRMYRVFRKAPQRIAWDTVEALTIHRTGPLMEIRGGDARIYVEFQNPGMPALLQFMESKTDGENQALVKELLEPSDAGPE